MGAETFSVRSEGKTAQEAFNSAVSQAQYDYGHRGYSGSIAEKSSFCMIDLPIGKSPDEYSDELIDTGDARIDDKWGDAGCFDLGDGTYYFFGWASS